MNSHAILASFDAAVKMQESRFFAEQMRANAAETRAAAAEAARGSTAIVVDDRLAYLARLSKFTEIESSYLDSISKLTADLAESHQQCGAMRLKLHDALEKLEAAEDHISALTAALKSAHSDADEKAAICRKQNAIIQKMTKDS